MDLAEECDENRHTLKVKHQNETTITTTTHITSGGHFKFDHLHIITLQNFPRTVVFLPCTE